MPESAPVFYPLEEKCGALFFFLQKLKLNPKYNTPKPWTLGEKTTPQGGGVYWGGGRFEKLVWVKKGGCDPLAGQLDGLLGILQGMHPQGL